MNTNTAEQAVSLSVQPLDTIFKMQGGTAQYIFRELGIEAVTDLGCPDSNAVLLGNHGHIVGHFEIVTGKRVRVTGWGSRQGMLVKFVPSGEQGETLKGWIGV